jgi:phenylacetate-CoA ligase
MNNSLARMIYRAGCRMKGASVLAYLEELKESQWWSGEKHEAVQLEKLRTLLAHARERAPFYREYFERHGFDCEVDSLASFKALPSVGKKEIASHRDAIQNEGRGGKLVYSKTAGTTSVPFPFYRSADWDAQHRAAIARGCSWYGVDPWTRSGHLWSISPRRSLRLKNRFLDFLQNRFRQKSFDLSPKMFEDFYRKLARAEHLAGYTGILYEFARFVNERHAGGEFHGLKLVKGTSEKIFPHYQDAARIAFGQPIRSEYGAAEAGIIAFECPEGSLHVNEEHVIVEIENGEIVVTNLLSHSFPFIRYRLGDYIRLREGFACSCGRKGLIIGDITGRVGLSVYGSGGRVFPSVVLDLIIKSLVLLGGLVAQCQAVQRAEGRLEYYCVPARILSQKDINRIERFFGEMTERYFEGAIECAVLFVESIPRTGSKFLEFVSDLPQKN